MKSTWRDTNATGDGWVWICMWNLKYNTGTIHRRWNWGRCHWGDSHVKKCKSASDESRDQTSPSLLSIELPSSNKQNFTSCNCFTSHFLRGSHALTNHQACPWDRLQAFSARKWAIKCINSKRYNSNGGQRDCAKSWAIHRETLQLIIPAISALNGRYHVIKTQPTGSSSEHKRSQRLISQSHHANYCWPCRAPTKSTVSREKLGCRSLRATSLHLKCQRSNDAFRRGNFEKCRWLGDELRSVMLSCRF